MLSDLDNTGDLGFMPSGRGYIVRRDRLMNELIAKGRKAELCSYMRLMDLERRRCYFNTLKKSKVTRRGDRCALSKPIMPLVEKCLFSSK